MQECPPGKHRTLVLVDVPGVPAPSEKFQSMICLNCGKAFVAATVSINDPQIDEVLKLAAEDTRAHLKKLRVNAGPG